MKILGKILVLLLVGLGLLSAIAVFYETQVSIPETSQGSNPHVDYLKRHSMAILGLDIDGKISETDPAKHLKDDSLENEYQKQLLSLRRFYDEKQISDSDYNHQIDTFALCYSEALISKAHKLFKDRTWPSDERYFLTKRVSELNALSNIDNNKVLASHSSLKSLIDAIATSCVDYAKAENLLSHSSYTSVYSAQNNIQKADALIEKGSLNLNTALIEELRSYPNKIGDSHLQLIKDLADGISNWRNNSLTTTVSRYERLISEVDAYSSNGSIYKGEHPYNVSQIRSNATSNKNHAIEELSTLYIDGYSSDVTRSLSSYSGSVTLSISTNYPGGYTLQDTSSQWFSISSKDSNSVTVSYNDNSNYEDRSDWFTVKAGKKSIKVTLNQIGKNAIIHSVKVDNDADVSGKKGLSVKVSFNVMGMKDKDGKVSCYFYDANGKALLDTNNSYCTSGTPSYVAVSRSIKPGYDNAKYTDYEIMIPYEELHLSNTNYTTLRVDVLIWDYSVTPIKTLTRKENTTFTCIPDPSVHKTLRKAH